MYYTIVKNYNKKSTVIMKFNEYFSISEMFNNTVFSLLVINSAGFFPVTGNTKFLIFSSIQFKLCSDTQLKKNVLKNC